MVLMSLVMAAADVLGFVSVWWVYSLGVDSLLVSTQDWLTARLAGASQRLGSSRHEMMTTNMLRNSYNATPSL